MKSNHRNHLIPGVQRSSRSKILALLFALLGSVLAASLHAATFNVTVAPGAAAPVYSPASLTIHVGDTVTWTWSTSADHAHSVTSGTGGHANGLFDSGVHRTPFSFSHTFTTAGTFPYFCTLHYSVGMVGTVVVSSATPGPSPGILSNISTRMRVETGDNVLIGGFVVGGTGPKQLVLRALGPTLTQFGVSNALADPTLELHNSTGGVLAFNDNWAEAANARSIPPMLQPPSSLESAILTSLNPGAYTAVVRGVNNSTGVALVEAYDIAPTASAHLINISTRGLVQTGDNVMIAGLIVKDNNQNVIIRALGPTLPSFGVPNALPDPFLELHDGNGTLLSANDNWKSTQQAQIIATGKAPPNDLEAAIVRTLPPGNYTAIVRGVNNTTGVALVEVYTLP